MSFEVVSFFFFVGWWIGFSRGGFYYLFFFWVRRVEVFFGVVGIVFWGFIIVGGF